jgi:hypothetical protein
MAEAVRLDKKKQSESTKVSAEEPGILDSFGSFPVWMLKIIQLITPNSLISKNPPEKKKYRL